MDTSHHSIQTPLSRAQHISAQATSLLSSLDPSCSPASKLETYERALDGYKRAAELFDEAKSLVRDDGALSTINLLALQNTTSLRSLTRKVQLERSRLKPPAASPAAVSSGVGLGGAGSPSPGSSPSRLPAQLEGKEKEKEKERHAHGSRDGEGCDKEKEKEALRSRRRRHASGSGSGAASASGGNSGQSSLMATLSSAPFARPTPSPHQTPTPSTPTSPSTTHAPHPHLLANSDLPSPSQPNHPHQHQHHSFLSPSNNASNAGSVANSALYASSSSSSTGGGGTMPGGVGESYVALGGALDASDPFARFWGVLETAFAQISNPVAFASAPLDVGGGGGGERERKASASGRKAGGAGVGESEAERKERRKKRGAAEKEEGKKGKGKDKEKEKRDGKPGKGKLSAEDHGEEGSSGGESSFYVVTNEQSSVGKGAPSPLTPSFAPPPLPSGHQHLGTSPSHSGQQSSSKTPEELALENASLRASLDAMARHTQEVEAEMRRVREREEKRGEMMKSVVMGVRMEAQRAIQGQEMLRSQMLLAQSSISTSSKRSSIPNPFSTLSSPSRRMSATAGGREDAETVAEKRKEPRSESGGDGDGDQQQLETVAAVDPEERIAELEAEVARLLVENQKTKAHLQRYKERFDKLKTSARAKREAKLTAAGGQQPSSLASVGEEENEV